MTEINSQFKLLIKIYTNLIEMRTNTNDQVLKTCNINNLATTVI